MEWVKGLCLFGVSFGVVFCAVCFANAAEVSFASNPLWLSTTEAVAGDSVQASTVITKQGTSVVSGTVTFYANGEKIGAADFSIPANTGGAVVSVSFVPPEGEYQVSAKVTRAVSEGEAVSVSGEARAAEALTVDPVPVTKTEEAAPALAGQAVAGAATTSGSALDQATGIAKNTGALLFAKSEDFRSSAAEYFDAKLTEAQAARKMRQEAAMPEDGADLDKILVAEPKSFTDQLKDTSGLLEGIKIQAYKAGTFVFNNLYIFYGLLLLVVLWVVRKIWKRFWLN